MSTKQIAEFDEVQAEMQALVAPVRSIQVTDFKSAEQATVAGKQVKVLLLRLETRRDELVRPLNTRVREINAYAKGIEAPLLQAERHIKAQLVAFEVQQEEKRKAEQRRIENERAQAEALLRIKQQQEREATGKAADSDEEDDEFGFGNNRQAEQERLALEEKHAQEQALLRTQAQQKIWDTEQKGVKNARKVWKCRLVDISLVPDQYKIVTLNEKAILAMARAGVTNIPGVELYQDTQIAIGANTYVPALAIEEEK